MIKKIGFKKIFFNDNNKFHKNTHFFNFARLYSIMKIVTLITDWRNDALYLAQIKGKIVSVSSDLNIIDLISDVVSFDIVDAAFVFKKSFKNFPPGTIHLNFIDNQRYDNQDFIVVKHNQQYFISRDNGFLSLVLPAEVDEIYKLKSITSTFEELFSFSLIIDAIIHNKLLTIAEQIDDFIRTFVMAPSISDFQIIGHIIYIDSYGNLITDVTEQDFYDFVKNGEFKIYFKTDRNMIDSISNHYSDVDSGDLVALFNSMGLLELAQRNGNLAEIFGVLKRSEIRIEKIIKSNDNIGSIF